MKRFFSFLLIVIISGAISFTVGAIFCATYNSFCAVSVFGGLFLAFIFGAFDEDEKEMKL